jgi:hypothetical protein
MDFEEEG